MNSDRLPYFWQYQTKCYEFPKKKEIFILAETNSVYCEERNFVYRTVMFSSCVKCVKFQTVLKTHLWQTPNISDCRNVYEDKSTFGSGYQEQIFVGRLPNDFSEMNRESDSECEESITFPIQPCKKSCFTSSLLVYRHLCCEFQEFYRENFVSDLHVLFRID